MNRDILTNPWAWITAAASVAIAATSLAVIQPHHAAVARKKAAGGGGGTSPGTTNMTAAYDFDDGSGTGQNDSHSNNLHLTENGTSSWTTGSPNYATVNATNYFTQSAIDNTPHFHWEFEDVAFAARVRLSSDAADEIVWDTVTSRGQLKYNSTANRFELSLGGQVNASSATTVTGTGWHIVCGYWDTDADEVWISVDDETLVIGPGGAEARRYSDFTFGGAGITNAVDIDWMYFWDGRELSQDEVTWLNANGDGLSYGDL